MMESRKDIFKALIREFHASPPPRVVRRDLRLPDSCLEAIKDARSSPMPALAVMIMGPRRAGKTRFLFQVLKGLSSRAESPLPRTQAIYINFEDDRLLPLEASDLASLIDAYFELYPDNRDREVAVFLDEVHQVEGWDLFVRRLLERRNLRIFITGSSSRLCSESLLRADPGRVLSFQLLPLSFREYLTFKGVEPGPDPVLSGDKYAIRFLLDEYLVFGGFPEVVESELSSKLRILRDYFDILIYKDLVERFAIRNVALLKKLVKHLSDRVGSAVSFNAFFQGLRSGTKISRETVMEYVSYLEQKDIISLVPLFSDSEKARQVNPRRVFCLDNGLRNAVSFHLAEDGERLAKNLVFQKLKRAGDEIFYWKERGEVDFVVCGDHRLRGINVSYGRELDASASKPLLEFRRSAGRRTTELEIITKDTEKVEAGINFVPLWKWLLTEPESSPSHSR